MKTTNINSPLLQKGYPALFWIASAGSNITKPNQPHIGWHFGGIQKYSGPIQPPYWITQHGNLKTESLTYWLRTTYKFVERFVPSSGYTQHNKQIRKNIDNNSITQNSKIVGYKQFRYHRKKSV